MDRLIKGKSTLAFHLWLHGVSTAMYSGTAFGISEQSWENVITVRYASRAQA